MTTDDFVLKIKTKIMLLTSTKTFSCEKMKTVYGAVSARQFNLVEASL